MIGPNSCTCRMDHPALVALILLLLIANVGRADAAAAAPVSGANRPNVLIWLMDDVGYGQVSAFGGPVETPTLERLAAQGLRFSNFHATALCSPSRAALLTGRNHHAVSMGSHAGMRTDDEGYRAQIPPSAATVARILQQNGYSTWAIGKWDQLPFSDCTPAGPFTYWPSGQGFERFYGFLYAEMDHFAPLLWSDHTPVEPAKGHPDYFLTTDLADQAIALLRQQEAATPGKPFFLYWATGAGHAPHHAPLAYREHYRGRFDQGWDQVRDETLARQKALGLVPADVQLPPRPTNIDAWDALTADDRRVAARSMEAFAGELTHADHEFGRILAELERLGKLQNTIVIVTSDNGASAAGGRHGSFNTWRFVNAVETTTADNLPHLDDWGGPSTYPEYPAGWAMAGNTPFRQYKTQVHFGGEREPMIMAWPAGIRARGEVRTQFHHLIDIMPTVLEAAHVEAPATVGGVKQQPIDGVSMGYTFDAPAAPTRHRVQYFEMLGNRAIVEDGWKAVVLHRKEPWIFHSTAPFADDVWELYDLHTDFNEVHDLASRDVGKLAELQKLFDREAKRNHVYPLAPDYAAFQQAEIAKQLEQRSGRFVYDGGALGRISQFLAPPVAKQNAFDIDARVSANGAATKGVIVAAGGNMGGYVLYLDAGRPVFCYNELGTTSTYLRGRQPVAAGTTAVHVRFRPAANGHVAVTMMVDGTTVADAELEHAMLGYQGSDVFSIGRDEGSRVSAEYGADNTFTGTIDQLTFDFTQH